MACGVLEDAVSDLARALALQLESVRVLERQAKLRVHLEPGVCRQQSQDDAVEDSKQDERWPNQQRFRWRPRLFNALVRWTTVLTAVIFQK